MYDGYDEPHPVGSIETRAIKLEKRIKELEEKLDKKLEWGHISSMNYRIAELYNQWILFRLIKEIVGIAFVLAAIAAIAFFFLIDP